VRLRRAGWCVLAAGLLLSACTGGGDDAAPTPTTQATTSTTAVDRTGIALAGVPGQTTTTIEERGSAQLTGSVQGPNGLVVGATVRIERMVAGREIRTDVLTGPDGRFALTGVPGGRYRVRAFLVPTLAQVEPEVRFVQDGVQTDFPLVVEEQGGVVVRADVAPEPPLLGRAVNLVVAVRTRAVSADGVVRSAPVIGAQVELAGLGRWVLRDDSAPSEDDGTTPTSFSTVGPSPFERTDASGLVRYELRCERAGSPNLSVRVPVRIAAPASGGPGATTDPTAASTSTTVGSTVTVQPFALDLPACVDPTTLTTTTSAGSGSTATTEP
jgi:hypothetical protein